MSSIQLSCSGTRTRVSIPVNSRALRLCHASQNLIFENLRIRGTHQLPPQCQFHPFEPLNSSNRDRTHTQLHSTLTALECTLVLGRPPLRSLFRWSYPISKSHNSGRIQMVTVESTTANFTELFRGRGFEPRRRQSAQNDAETIYDKLVVADSSGRELVATTSSRQKN